MSTPPPDPADSDARLPPEAGGGESREAAPPPKSKLDLRQQRLQDLVISSLRESEPLQANLGAACAESLILHRRFFEMIAPKVHESDDPAGILDRLSPAIAIYMKLGNQATQCANLFMKLEQKASKAS